MLFLSCGLRVSELVSLNVTDVYEDHVIVLGKGNKERVVFFAEGCREAIDDYLAVRNDENIKESDKKALFISQKRCRMTTRAVQYMLEKKLLAAVFTWWVSFDYRSLEVVPDYTGPVLLDFYGRLHPRHANGTVRLPRPTDSISVVREALLFSVDEKTDHRLLYRRLGVAANDVSVDHGIYQLDFFTDYEAQDKERRIQGAMLEVRRKYGANAVVKGMNLLEGATAMERNRQIGGHRA